MYSILPHPNDNKVDLQLLQYDKNFSKKPITQIEVISDYQLLFSLSDGIISVNDISRHTFPLVHVAPKTRGATVFALDVMVNASTVIEIDISLLIHLFSAIEIYDWRNGTNCAAMCRR